MFSDGIILATQFINVANTGFQDIMHWNRLVDSPDTDILPFVREKATIVVQKNTYTACTDEVLRILKENDVSEVFLAGIDTDCCVLATATGLFEHNLRPIVLEHYCASNGGKASHQAAITVMKRTIGVEQIFYGAYSE